MPTVKEEIRQTRGFRNERHRAIVNLMFSSTWIRTSIKDFLAPFNLSPQQYNVLRILRGAKRPISIRTVRERMLDKMSDASRIVNRMHRAGLVVKEARSGDRRLVDIELSALGSKVLEQVDRNAEQMDRIMDGLTDEEAGQLCDLLNKARAFQMGT